MGASHLWNTKWYSLIYFIAHVVAMSSTLWNPILYGWMNENFRKELASIVKRTEGTSTDFNEPENDTRIMNYSNNNNGSNAIP